jgi:hypothetical protein
MAAFDSIGYRWVGSCLGLGTELVVRATRSICDGSLLNADSGRADTRARLDEWAGVLSLYDPLTDTKYVVPVASQASA